MRTLVIETATPVLSVALFDDEVLLAAEHRTLGRGHAEALLPVIAALPEGGRAGRILVSCGPGSFTGIRVGLSAARALGFAWGAPVTGYETLALIGLCADLPHGVPRAVAVPGGHGEVFICEPGLAVISMPPNQAAATLQCPDVVGAAAAALVAARGWGTAYAADADARRAGDLPPVAMLPAAHPVYGRPPDAKPSKAQA
jgi:tRNA threonylcarbamoyladenosine biosynthesis protein TsaB